MEVIVEIGDANMQAAIKAELSLYSVLLSQSNPPLDLKSLYVTEQFEATVRKLEAGSAYQSERGLGELKIRGEAKAIRLAEGCAIVFSASLYSQHDYQGRVCIYLHEWCHTQNWLRFPKLDGEPRARLDYLSRLYALYDEYSADRRAYRLTDDLFSETSSGYLERLRAEADGYKTLLADDTYRAAVETEVGTLGVGLPAWEKFMRGIQPVMADIGLVTSHAFALMHHWPNLLSLADLRESNFINTRTVALTDYLKQKFESNSFDLIDGIDLCRDYTRNFGYIADDLPDGSTYFRILNPWIVGDNQAHN